MIDFGDNQVLRSTDFYCHDCKQDRGTVLVPTAKVRNIGLDRDNRKVNFSREYKRQCDFCGGSKLGIDIRVEIEA